MWCRCGGGDEESWMMSEGRSCARIYFLFERNRKEARDKYREAFGRRIDDPRIDDELERLSRKAAADDKAVVRVPAKLALALVMRSRGRGQGRRRPPKERWAARNEALAISTAEARWAELIVAGEPSKRAKHAAALEAHNQYGKTARVGAATIERQMRLERGKAALAKND
jgi:hypothetical protein